MNKLILFTDGSVNTLSKIGYGACLVLQEHELLLESLKESVKVKRFENTSSTRLELETLIWALTEIPSTIKQVLVYTDSQNIVGLLGRRVRLEQNDYRSKNNRLLNNHDLYREFYNLMDKLDCEIIKVKGHMPTRKKDNISKCFTLVDRASRKALRSYSQ